jgi:copper chaperone CopZ
MKNNFLALSIFIFCFSITISTAQENSSAIAIIENAKTTEVLIGIDGMACQEGCADKIALNLMEIEGVSSAVISFDQKNGIVVFDPKLTTIEDLKSAITNTKVKEYQYTINSVTIKERE